MAGGAQTTSGNDAHRCASGGPGTITRRAPQAVMPRSTFSDLREQAMQFLVGLSSLALGPEQAEQPLSPRELATRIVVAGLLAASAIVWLPERACEDTYVAARAAEQPAPVTRQVLRPVVDERFVALASEFDQGTADLAKALPSQDARQAATTVDDGGEQFAALGKDAGATVKTAATDERRRDEQMPQGCAAAPPAPCAVTGVVKPAEVETVAMITAVEAAVEPAEHVATPAEVHEPKATAEPTAAASRGASGELIIRPALRMPESVLPGTMRTARRGAHSAAAGMPAAERSEWR